MITDNSKVNINLLKKVEELEKEIDNIKNQSKAMQVELNDTIEQLKRERIDWMKHNYKLEKDKLFFYEQWEAVSKENTELKKIIKEAINLPKGVEPHSYSDLKNKR